MKYIYYPGCSLEGTAREYNISTQAAMKAMGADLVELEDWTCCGASAAEATSFLLSMVLAARNLARGEKMEVDGDFLIPCSACYLNLRRVEDHVRRDEALLDKINAALEEEDLEYKGGIRVRHLLDVVATDFEPQKIRSLVKRSLAGLRVAPYYGCQALRPYPDFDDPQEPRCMEPLIDALGAEIHPWSAGAKCCGAALMTTKKEVALELTGGILKAARGADCIVTICPMCQMNLEAYQDPISKMTGEDLHISIVYLPQLMGLAFGLTKEDLRLNLNLAITDGFKEKMGI
ncbi:MAG: CoB--CoM heterodisulfide reductase iron-sulfur subunit B family protein [Deltaproteobacteria bacterium]|nr:CoB--CoM heterodisulfide reductase iron-sulfur subunit B family protein [Deltaproteobacteria bacterium]MBW1941518.1 CoB--CoM heterodisulfide reductase iron-sulfur subunit B family protein [Deltaproteobacteria bacterium]MBW2285642.1 CoB--CoM heterodisulfide reductase iron-sulfur subunit B family protein [Deltaproteobacteria bacterium]